MALTVGGIGTAGRDYVQDERYIAIEHMDVQRDYVQDERYIAIEHMDVRRDCLSLAEHNNYAVQLFMTSTTPKQSRPAVPIPPT